MNHHLAQTLKSLRAQREWSLAQAAESTGVSKAMLGQIERGESSPTVATLWKIATGFNVPFSVFLEPVVQPQPTPQRYEDLPGFHHETAGMHMAPLFPFDRQLGFDMFVIDLAPGALSESSPHEAGVIEHAIVIEGEMELAINGEWHRLSCGQALRFQADCPHGYRNRSSHRARFHNLIHYPPAQRRP